MIYYNTYMRNNLDNNILVLKYFCNDLYYILFCRSYKCYQHRLFLFYARKTVTTKQYIYIYIHICKMAATENSSIEPLFKKRSRAKKKLKKRRKGRPKTAATCT